MIREINPSSNICVCYNLKREACYKLVTKDVWGEQKQSIDTLLKKIDEGLIDARNVVIGPHRSMMIETSDNSVFTVGIEFKTGIRKRFFGREVSKMTDKIIIVDNSNAILSNLADIISKCTTADIFGVVDNYLIEKYLPYMSQRSENDYLLELINKVSGNPFDANIDTMSQELHTCPRNFERLFKQYTGLTPKQFVSIKKINKVSECMIEHQEKSLVEVLEMCGYYDQTHINRDFKIIGGLPATQVFQNIKQKLVNSPDTLGLNYDVEGVCGFNLLM